MMHLNLEKVYYYWLLTKKKLAMQKYLLIILCHYHRSEGLFAYVAKKTRNAEIYTKFESIRKVCSYMVQ